MRNPTAPQVNTITVVIAEYRGNTVSRTVSAQPPMATNLG
jgi:hypothetical protein